MRKEAKSTRHLLIHYPKNPYCKACQAAKATDTPTFKKGGSESAPKPKKWGDHTTCDHIVADKEWEQGANNEKYCLVLRAVGMKQTAAYPSTAKQTKEVARCIRNWQGKNKVVYVCTDNADELTASKKHFGIIDETSTAGR